MNRKWGELCPTCNMPSTKLRQERDIAIETGAHVSLMALRYMKAVNCHARLLADNGAIADDVNESEEYLAESYGKLSLAIFQFRHKFPNKLEECHE